MSATRSAKENQTPPTVEERLRQVLVTAALLSKFLEGFSADAAVDGDGLEADAFALASELSAAIVDDVRAVSGVLVFGVTNLRAPEAGR